MTEKTSRQGARSPDSAYSYECKKKTMRFNDIVFDALYRFAIGKEEDSGKYYLSIPVANQYIEYEEYYEISETQFRLYVSNIEEAIGFAQKCKNRRCDELLIQKPGKYRGVD